jgi:hypothetical protein
MPAGSPTSADLLEEARKVRTHAARARRMASGLTQISDRLRLERYAEELEQRAADLERQAMPDAPPRLTSPPIPPPLVTQPQEQVQQQQQAEPQPQPKK